MPLFRRNVCNRGSPQTCHLIQLAFLSVFSVTASAHAATYYVATNGSDSNAGSQAQPFKNIQKAVGVVRAGDTVMIEAGRYPAFVLRNIHGAAGAPITFKGETGAVIDRNLSGDTVLRNIEFYGGSYLTIDGLELTDSDSHQDPIVNCTTVRTSSRTARQAIKLNPAGGEQYPHHLIFYNLDIHNVGSHGILGTADDSQLLNSHIHDNGDMSRNVLGYGTYIKGMRWIIRGNRIHNNNGNGMRTGNDSSPHERLVDSAIENNVIYNNNGQGAHPSGPTGCRIITGGDGIVVWHGSGNIVRNNIVYGNGRGIRIDEDTIVNNTPNAVYNNTVYKNAQEGLYTFAGQKTIFKNNISYLNSGQNIFASASSVLSNNLTTDPLFVNAAAGDFGVQAGSAAIDKGMTLAEVPTDFTGKQRPEGAAYDIGAFEGAGSRADVLPGVGAGLPPGAGGGGVFYAPDGSVCPSGYSTR